MNNRKEKSGLLFFLVLTGIFIASLVACNLIFKKFFYWQPFESIDFTFIMSVGILPYPITFLVTDLISELYGKKRANQVVASGLIVSLFVMCVILVADLVPAQQNSPVNDETFTHVFGNTPAAIISSMLAYLFAQFIDVRLFHFIKKLTNGKKLWLSNNLSTIPSQLIDTSVVLMVLCVAGELNWADFWVLLASGFLFKVIIAIIDTPVLYMLVHLAREFFNLKLGEEILLGDEEILLDNDI